MMFRNSVRLLVVILIVTFVIFFSGNRSTPRASANGGQFHHYALIDVGALGGPSSFFNTLPLTDALGFGSVFYGIQPLEGGDRSFVGFAETATPDPYPGFCFTSDCFVDHAFQWTNGVTTDLGALPGGGSSAAFAINRQGWITGASQNGQTDPLIAGLPEIRAVLWKNGQIRDLGTLGGATSFAQAINSQGQITGLALNDVPDPFSYYYLFLYGFQGGTQTRAFLWDQKEGMQDLGTLGGPDAFPSLINQRGQVAGFSYINSTPDPNVGLPPFHPFLWEKGKGMKDLGSFGGVETASVNGLNNRGEVVGGLYLPGEQTIHPFLWDGQKLIDLVEAPFGGPGEAEANWINDAGEVVGTASLPATCPAGSAFNHIQRGFLWGRGSIRDLGALANDVPLANATYINSKSQVVGIAFNCTGDIDEAVLWEHGSIADLNALISPPSAFHLFWGIFIDDGGTIAALGLTPDLAFIRAFLLIPCDANHPGVAGCDYTTAAAPR